MYTMVNVQFLQLEAHTEKTEVDQELNPEEHQSESQTCSLAVVLLSLFP